jgi:Trk-type K+ transport system membrane component
MTIRSTNVYEERGVFEVTLLLMIALGMHGEHAPGEANQQSPQEGVIFSKYLRQHLLPQIYFDLWPIAVATLLICIVERSSLMDQNNTGWIGVWQILFEVTSGYGTVGLSFNNP